MASLPLPAWQPAGGYKLDPSLIHAVIRAESGFDPAARSPKGALGLMQVLPDTARDVAKVTQLAYAGEGWLLDPPNNMAVGQAWLRQLAATSTVQGNLVHLLAAYNAGEGRLAGWLGKELAGTRGRPAAVHRERAAGGNPRLHQEGAGQPVGVPGEPRPTLALADGAGREPLARPGARRKPPPKPKAKAVPGRLDESRAFQPLRIAVLTVSDTRTAADDRSGDTLASRIEAAGHELVARAIVKDDRDAIAAPAAGVDRRPGSRS